MLAGAAPHREPMAKRSGWSAVPSRYTVGLVLRREPSCVRLLSLADAANGARPHGDPKQGAQLLRVSRSGESGLNSGRFPAPGVVVAPVSSSSAFVAHPSIPTDPPPTDLACLPQPSALDPSFAPLPFLLDGAMRSTAGASRGCGSFPVPAVGVARDCSPSFTTPSRGAVTAVTSHGGDCPQGAATPQGLTTTAAHNVPSFAGSGVARPADLPALALRSCLITPRAPLAAADAERCSVLGARQCTPHWPVSCVLAPLGPSLSSRTRGVLRQLLSLDPPIHYTLDPSLRPPRS